LGVIVVQPFGHQLAHLGQQAKRVGIEQFTAKRAVEALDIGILRRLTRLNPVQHDAMLRTPLAQPNTGKLGSVVRAQLRESAMRVDQARQHLHDPTGGQEKVSFYPQ
jgi:hypothetical protein